MRVGEASAGREMHTEVLVIGGGLGGVACAMTAARLGMKTVLVEETDWLGGQASAQGIPFDEYPWNESLTVSRSYSAYRERIRQYYLDNLPLTPEARTRFPLNPGMGIVSTLSHDPRVSARVLEDMLSVYTLPGRIRILKPYRLSEAHLNGDAVVGATVENVGSGDRITIHAQVVIDSTEIGELIERAGVEHVVGAESKADTGELNALDVADPLEQQGFNWAFAADYFPDEDYTTDRPRDYDFWRTFRLPYWPGPHLGFLGLDHFTHEPKQRPLFAGDSDEELLRDGWHFRRIARRRNFSTGFFDSDISVFCSIQNEYLRLPLLGVDATAMQTALQDAKQLSLSYLYWLQTEAPRHDGGIGYRGLRLRPDVFETADGLAKQPYTREGRRIVSEFRLLEQHIGVDARPGADSAEQFADAVGIAAYRLNVHPTRVRDAIDIDCFPYQIPLGILLPVRVENLIAGCCKTVGGTRMTTASLRHHPIDWVIGEAAGALAAHAVRAHLPPRAIRSDPERLIGLQRALCELGVTLRWPEFNTLSATHAMARSWSELSFKTLGPFRSHPARSDNGAV